MNENEKIRELIFSKEFSAYLTTLDERTKNKFGEYFILLQGVRVLNRNIVKRLIDTRNGIYELRVSVGFNEYRSILFAADHDNIIESTQIVFLNGFLKKSTKDYDKAIKTAIKILNDLNYETDIRP